VEPLHLKLQGLWVGAALGELYATGLLNENRFPDLSMPLTLPKTHELCETAAHCLNAPADNLETLILGYERSPNFLLTLLPLTFLHRAGIQGLNETLASGLAHPDEPDTFASAITVTQALNWFLNPSRSPQNFIPALLKTPAFRNTVTAAKLENIQTSLTRYERFQSFPAQDSSQWTPNGMIGPVLYVLLSTPNDFRLTLQRAALLMPQQPERLMLIGALSGLQNGLRSLPLSWRLMLRTIRSDGVRSLSLEEELFNLANICAAQWAGCYTIRPKNWSDVAIAPPGHLRPR
jgi:hypothetical protein